MIETLDHSHPLFSRIPGHVRDMVPYRPGKPLEELKEEYGFDKVIKLASNENPFGASPMALEALQRALPEMFRYPDPVARRLRRRLAESLNVQPETIVLAAGSESLLSASVRAFMEQGDTALAPYGAFMGFAIHLSAAGGKLVTVPSPDYRFDIDALIAAVTPDTRILYLPNPNNPTGTYFTQPELQRILAEVPRSTLILLDEAYIEFCGDFADYPDSIALMQDNLLILRTFSKAYGLAGLRIGYAVGHPTLVEQLGKVKMTFEPSLPAQVAAEAAWQDSAFLEKGVNNNRQELQRYYDTLDSLGLQYLPSAGNFIMIPMQDADAVNHLNEALLRRGIAVRPLAAFGFPHCIRISIGLPEENTALFDALRDILPTR